MHRAWLFSLILQKCTAFETANWSDAVIVNTAFMQEWPNISHVSGLQSLFIATALRIADLAAVSTSILSAESGIFQQLRHKEQNEFLKRWHPLSVGEAPQRARATAE
jgi:hypothetical protein